MSEAPKPGIYYDIPFADYLAWDAISNSRITLALKSLQHFREQAAMEQTPTLRLGSFIHCGVLEPMAIMARYVVMPPFEKDPANVTAGGERSESKSTKFYKAKSAEFERVNADKAIVEESDYKKLAGIHRALMRSKRAAEYLGERGDAEVSIVWNDAETGLTCKARVDLLNSALNDLKSCADAVAFPRSIAKYGYHRQGAHYVDGYTAITGEIKPFRLIAVETIAPFGVRAAPLNEDAIETGRSEVRRALRAIADAYESDNWPCYEDPSSWCLPSYYDAGDDDIELIIGGQSTTL
jgi:hypothetical protein